MKQKMEKLSLMIGELQQNENIIVTVSKIDPGYSDEYLKELEEGLELNYNKDLASLFKIMGGVSVLWSASQTKFVNEIPEEDLNYLNGSIQILNPFDMVMGKTGTRWKDVLWFANMEPAERKEISSFLPFDFPSTELIAGFKLAEKKISDEMYLLSSNEGLSLFQMTLVNYIDHLVKTKGFNYWQLFLSDKVSAEYQRFKKYMPLLFTDFNLKFI